MVESTDMLKEQLLYNLNTINGGLAKKILK